MNGGRFLNVERYVRTMAHRRMLSSALKSCPPHNYKKYSYFDAVFTGELDLSCLAYFKTLKTQFYFLQIISHIDVYKKVFE